MKSFALLLALTFTQSFEKETVDRLQEYLEVDTINPPGNESRAVDLLRPVPGGRRDPVRDGHLLEILESLVH
jgi:hypothetical protein